MWGKIVLGILLAILGLAETGFRGRKIFAWFAYGLGIVVSFAIWIAFKEQTFLSAMEGLAFGVSLLLLSYCGNRNLEGGIGLLFMAAGLLLGFWNCLFLFVFSLELMLLKSVFARVGLPGGIRLWRQEEALLPYMLLAYPILWVYDFGAIL